MSVFPRERERERAEQAFIHCLFDKKEILSPHDSIQRTMILWADWVGASALLTITHAVLLVLYYLYLLFFLLLGGGYGDHIAAGSMTTASGAIVIIDIEG